MGSVPYCHCPAHCPYHSLLLFLWLQGKRVNQGPLAAVYCVVVVVTTTVGQQVHEVRMSGQGSAETTWL